MILGFECMYRTSFKSDGKKIDLIKFQKMCSSKMVIEWVRSIYFIVGYHQNNHEDGFVKAQIAMLAIKPTTLYYIMVHHIADLLQYLLRRGVCWQTLPGPQELLAVPIFPEHMMESGTSNHC